MEESFRAADTDELRRQRWAGELCLNHPCEDEITEDQAKDLLDGLTASMQRASDQRLSWIGFVVGALSLICSIFALWQTHENSRVARDASERSIRNETKIDMMRDG